MTRIPSQIGMDRKFQKCHISFKCFLAVLFMVWKSPVGHGTFVLTNVVALLVRKSTDSVSF